MFWHVFVFIAAVAVSYLMMPKPQNVKPAGIEDFKAPTAEEGREIPVLFGTRDLRGPNIVWYGDLKAVPIKKGGGKK